MPRTLTDLIVKALDKLGVSQDGQDPSAEEKAVIDGLVQPILDTLAVDTVYIADPDAIDEKFFLPLATILANNAANDFGGAYDEQVDFREKAKLRVLQPRPGGFSPLRADYF